jgi:hypothetical protein
MQRLLPQDLRFEAPIPLRKKGVFLIHNFTHITFISLQPTISNNPAFIARNIGIC